MLKLTPTKLAVCGDKLIKGRVTIATFDSIEEADAVYETMVKMYVDAKEHGMANALIISGILLSAAGALAKGIYYAKSIKR